MDLHIENGTIQIEDSANGFVGDVVRETPNIYRAIVVHRHFSFSAVCRS